MTCSAFGHRPKLDWGATSGSERGHHRIAEVEPGGAAVGSRLKPTERGDPIAAPTPPYGFANGVRGGPTRVRSETVSPVERIKLHSGIPTYRAWKCRREKGELWHFAPMEALRS
jgi:hypothetical protein